MREALHVTDGDATEVAGTGPAERVVLWRDVLHDGPVPHVPDDELRRVRAGPRPARRAGRPGRPRRAERPRPLGGGTHLLGHHPARRWDDGRERVLEEGP